MTINDLHRSWKSSCFSGLALVDPSGRLARKRTSSISQKGGERKVTSSMN